MDPNVAAAALAAQPTSPTIMDWIAQYGNMIAFFAQIIYWIAIVVLFAYAVVQYKRWVNYQLGIGRSGKLRTGAADEVAETPKAKQAVSIEEFVE